MYKCFFKNQFFFLLWVFDFLNFQRYRALQVDFGEGRIKSEDISNYRSEHLEAKLKNRGNVSDWQLQQTNVDNFDCFIDMTPGKDTMHDAVSIIQFLTAQNDDSDNS